MLDTAKGIVGPDCARAGGPADAIDGVRPAMVVEPATPEAVGATLEWASREKLAVLTRGAGTKLGWGAPPKSVDVLLSTTRLNAVVAHRHGDLTATVQAGAPLAEVNKALARHRQWIPLDPPFSDRATIGGLVATNDSGPRRHRYGAPRDLIIGVDFARTDGRLAKGGGIVVKNVAGYDMPRLMTGSFGSLAVIVSATFKLYPLAAESRTVIADLGSPADLASILPMIAGSHLTPTAVEFQSPPLRLLVRFESIQESVEQQSEATVSLMSGLGFSTQMVAASGEDESWQQHDHFESAAGAATIKVSVLPSELPAALSLIEGLTRGAVYKAWGRAGMGVFLVRVAGDADLQKAVIAGIRNSQAIGRGSAVIREGTRELRTAVDVWGPIGDGLPLMQAVKRQFDPAGILHAGRAPGNL